MAWRMNDAAVNTLSMVGFVAVLEALGVLTFRKYVAGLAPDARRRLMAWTILILAGLSEVVWLVALKNSNGFANVAQGVFSIAVSWLSFFMLAFALKFIPAGTAYAVWTGCGAAGGALAGMWLFGEERSALRVASLLFIVIGIVGIRLGENAVAS
jgi:quaternary ammonium compound-resistance protein SugE